MEDDKYSGAANTPFKAGDAVIYNTTYQVLHPAHEAWLQWMLDIFIPEILGTGCFVKHQLVRVLDTDEVEGPVYAVQYYAATRAGYDQFVALYETGFKQQEAKMWASNIFTFSSLMQVVG